MAKCDVCGKTSLLPEKFGEINVCKICFMKANGLLWKHKYERYEEAEKQRCKALESVHKHNFPQPVVSAINDFFINQMNSMVKCECCNGLVRHLDSFENISVCKQCMKKINPSAWQRQYERQEEAEKQRCKTLESAHKHQFPQPIISAINDFFINQMNSMVRCECCGELVSQLKSFDGVEICNRCFSKIDISAWNKTDYEDNDEIEIVRQNILKTATKNNFSNTVIELINKHFDEKIIPDLICSINGNLGQKLRVYTYRCILTTSDDFDVETISEAYSNALGNSNSIKNSFSKPVAKELSKTALDVVSGLGLGGVGVKVAKKAINYATSAAINIAENSTSKKQIFKVHKGGFSIYYNVFDYVDYQECGDNEVGFIRFRNSKNMGNPNEDLVFFFDCDNEKIEIAYKAIYNGIFSARQPKPLPAETDGYKSNADEILKYKNLLDIGAITQDEFDAKKKELLGL